MAPPFAGSEVVTGPNQRPIMTVLNGVQMDPTRFMGQMVPWKAILSDEQIAAVLTHIRGNFGNSASAITPEMVAAGRKQYGSDGPYAIPDLDEVKADIKP